MKLEIVNVHIPSTLSVVLGQFHGKNTVENIDASLNNDIPNIRFGLACHQTSGSRFIGTDHSFINLAKTNAERLGVEELFVLFVENTIPKSVLKALKKVPEISEIYCATSKPVEMIITNTNRGKTVMGLADDYSSSSISNNVKEIQEQNITEVE